MRADTSENENAHMTPCGITVRIFVRFGNPVQQYRSERELLKLHSFLGKSLNLRYYPCKMRCFGMNIK